MHKRVLIVLAGAPLLLLTLGAGKPPANPQAVVDRPRLDQKLRRALDSVATALERAPAGDRVLVETMEEARTQLEQARSQLAAERSADAWLSQQLEAERAAPDAGAPSLRNRDPYGTDVAMEHRPQPAIPLPAGREPLGEVGLHTIVNAMRGQDFRGGKLRILAQAAPAYVFTVAQVIELLGEFVAPSDRLEALQLMVPHLADRANAPVLYRACSNETERSVVRRLLE